VKLWVDSESGPSDWDDAEWVMTGHEATGLLSTGKVTHLSLRSDLPIDDDRTVLSWMVDEVRDDPDFIIPTVLRCHGEKDTGMAAKLRQINLLRISQWK